MARTASGNVTDRAILEALSGGPLSTREISDALFRRIREEWSERHGYDFEWATDEEPLGARLLASSEARDAGYRLQSWEIRPRLARLERLGEVERIQVEGHRPMLWRRSQPRG